LRTIVLPGVRQKPLATGSCATVTPGASQFIPVAHALHTPLGSTKKPSRHTQSAGDVDPARSVVIFGSSVTHDTHALSDAPPTMRLNVPTGHC
jgi:hypothetical protein